MRRDMAHTHQFRAAIDQVRQFFKHFVGIVVDWQKAQFNAIAMNEIIPGDAVPWVFMGAQHNIVTLRPVDAIRNDVDTDGGIFAQNDLVGVGVDALRYLGAGCFEGLDAARIPPARPDPG